MTESIPVLGSPPPELSDAALRALLHDTWELPDPRVVRLDSERDLNAMVNDQVVIKVSNAAEPDDVIDMEVAALEHIARTDPGLPVPRAVPSSAGALVEAVVDDAGRRCAVRVSTALAGRHLEGQPLTAALAEQIGSMTARTSTALQGFFHPAAGREIAWDIRRVETMADNATEPLGEVVARVRPALRATEALPSWIQHADMTLTNVLAVDRVVTGVVDVGDMHHTAAACDLAVALASVLRNTAADQPLGSWQLADAVLRGYQRIRPLSPQEVGVLGELVLARLALTELISGSGSAGHANSRGYISQWDVANRRVLRELAAIPPAGLADKFGSLAGTAMTLRFLGGELPDRALPTVADRDPAVAEPSTTAPAAAGRISEQLLHRRHTVMAGPLSPLFYRHPLEVVRGRGTWLYTHDGTELLDAYNNVAVVGHAHPTVTQAVSRQLAVLNTHSRYLHAGAVELAERIVATMPAELDTCLFTTSGTEANDLAWRMAAAFTGGTGAIVVEHAYHGSSSWMADLSSSEWPAGYRADQVAIFEAPRAIPADGAAHIAAQRISAAAADLNRAGDSPALVLTDTMFTSEGVLDPAPEFLHGMRTGAHRAGALLLADEVQAGYGRCGPAMWRFALSGVVPDLVSLGKPMGAGYPIGAVVTRREIADALAARNEYFSTFAASPAAAAAGLAVLDVLQAGDIPGQAEQVGGYLREQLAMLAAEQPGLGQIRGTGLVAGVDLLPPTGRGSGEHAKDVLDGLVAERVVAGLTGPGGDVLKVRPPLIWEAGHVDLFVDRLRRVLVRTRER